MRSAPHLARPLTLVIPHHERQWPLRALRLGMFALDHAAQSSLPRSRILSLDEGFDGPLHRHFVDGVTYSDCAVDNSRLAVHNAMDARSRGAEIFPRLRCTIAERDGAEWHLSLESATHNDRYIVAANLLINAAGGRAAGVLNHVIHGGTEVRVRLTRNAWIVVRYPAFGTTAYALPNDDGQIAYALPLEGETVLLGPLATPYQGDPGGGGADGADASRLVDLAEQYFRRSFSPADIVRSFAKITAMPVNA